MQSVRWITFCVSNALTRTMVHFYPSSGNVTAPYPTMCKLSLFGQGQEEKTVTLEGARLSQPDGVRIEEVFPALKSELSGLFGLVVEITTPQPRVDLSGSLCAVEFCSRAHSARFWPKRLRDENTSIEGRYSGMAIRDALNVCSLLVVNPMQKAIRPNISLMVPRTDGTTKVEVENVKLGDVPPLSVQEISLSEYLGDDLAATECSFGLLRAASTGITVNVAGDKPLPADAGLFMLYRDVLTKRPLSVCAL